MTDYRPMSCDRYAELELATLRKEQLRVAWRTEQGQNRMDQLRPLDLRTRHKAEYLIAEDSQGNALEIRLDRIRRFEGL